MFRPALASIVVRCIVEPCEPLIMPQLSCLLRLHTLDDQVRCDLATPVRPHPPTSSWAYGPTFGRRRGDGGGRRAMRLS